MADVEGPLGFSGPCQSLPAPGLLDPLRPPGPRLCSSYSWPPRLSFRATGSGRRTLCRESSCWGSTQLPTQTNPSRLFDGFTGRETASSRQDSTPQEARIHDGASGERSISEDASPFMSAFTSSVLNWQSHPRLSFSLGWPGQDKTWSRFLCAGVVLDGQY